VLSGKYLISIVISVATSADIIISCGTAPYDILIDGTTSISSTQSDVTIDNLGNGSRSIEITDATGSTLPSPLRVEITPSDPISFVSADIILPRCASPAGIFPNNGGIQNIVIDGGIPFSDGFYDLDWGGVDNGRNFVPGVFAPGIYDVIISDSIGCQTTAQFDLTVNPITISASSIPARCNGGNGGSVSVQGSGGTGATDIYRFFIQSEDGSSYNDRIDNQTSSDDFLNVPPGNYLVWAEDGRVATGICELDTAVVTVGSEQQYSISTMPNTTLSCGAGESGVDIIVSRTEDTGEDISYQIFDKSDGSLAASMTPTSNLTISECLSEGFYDIQIEDGENCMFIDSFMVDGCALAVDTSSQGPECIGLDEGFILLDVTSSTGAVEYLWEDNSTMDDRSNLGPGTYAVTISDMALCTLTFEWTFQDPPPDYTLIFDADPIACIGEGTDIIAIPQGGIGPYEYIWDPDPTGTFENTLVGVGPGTYRVTVIDDDLGCEVVDSVTIEEPTVPVIMIEDGPRAPSCQGEMDGFVQLSINPTAEFPGPFVFRSPSGTTFAGSISAQIDDLEEGPQFVIVETLAGCELERVEFTVPGGNGLQLDIANSTIPDVICFGDEVAVSLEATGSGTITTFDWGAPINASGNFMFVSAGEYEITITSGNCTSVDTLVIEGPEPFTSRIDNNLSDLAQCADEPSDLIASTAGGTRPYTFRWLNLSGAIVSRDSFALGLMPDTYELITLDGMGCEAPRDTIIIEPIEMVEGTIGQVIDPECFGEDGQVFVDTSTTMGGTGPYRYIIDAQRPVSELDTTSLPASETPYEAIIVDVNGCRSDPTPFSIVIPEEVSVSITGDSLIDIGFSGDIEALTISTSPVDTIIWSTDEGDVPFTCLNADCSNISIQPSRDVTFVATLINEDGCMAMASFDVDVTRNENFYIPNILYAGDGVVSNARNRTFQVYPGNAVESIDFMRIYDRWGNLVHEENALPLPVGNEGTGSWDGTSNNNSLTSGVYVYVVQVRFLGNPDPKILKGDVTLVR